jgi:transcriptional regulator with XRE-family HTH domain
MRMTTAESASVNSALRVFAEELRQSRTARGLSQDQLAEQILFSASQVGMVESARRVPSLDFAQRADKALATTGTFERLHRLLREAFYPESLQQFTVLEAEAAELRSWQPLVVDGLFQTPDYARTVLSAPVGLPPEEIDRRVAARMERQLLFSRPAPPLLWSLMDEGALRRLVGGPDVMRAQLEHLTEMAEHPSVVVQITRMDVGVHDGVNGAFMIADFAAASGVALLDTALGGLIIDRSEQVAAVRVNYESIKASALTRAASAQFLRELAKEWT